MNTRETFEALLILSAMGMGIIGTFLALNDATLDIAVIMAVIGIGLFIIYYVMRYLDDMRAMNSRREME